MLEFVNTDPFIMIFGLFYVVVGLSCLVAPKAWQEFIDLFATNQVVVLTFGMITLLLGLVIVVTQSSWETIPHGLLTVVGWGALIEGVVMLLRPQLLQSFVNTAFYRTMFRFGGYLGIGFGCAFLFL